VISCKNLGIWSFIDVCYELRTYDRGMAQLGSAGVLIKKCNLDSFYDLANKFFRR
tara:strand:- start:170 stop:334 length:165 start_codon:yes stop_codon:yes gene_type:complete